MKLRRPVTHAVVIATSAVLAGVHFADSGAVVEHRFAPISANAQTADNSSIGIGREATIN